MKTNSLFFTMSYFENATFQIIFWSISNQICHVWSYSTNQTYFWHSNQLHFDSIFELQHCNIFDLKNLCKKDISCQY